MPVVGLLVLVGLLLASTWAIRTLYRNPHAGVRTRVAAGVVGGALGALLCFFRYMPNENAVIWGLPLPVVVFERHGNQWLDFVGPLMIPIALLNLIIVAAVVHITTSAIVTIHARRRRSAGA